MASDRRIIGSRYDRDKFVGAFRVAAREMVSDSYKDPDVPTGETLQEMLIQAMEERLQSLPVSYYRVFEAIADGKSAAEIEALASGTLVDKHKGAGDRRIALLMMDMNGECADRDFCISDPAAAERYYDERFPEKSRHRIHVDLDSRSSVGELSKAEEKKGESEVQEDSPSRKRVTLFGIHRKEKTAPIADTRPQGAERQKKKDDPIV